MKKYRIGEYMRELSIVILGVAVTFISSALISSHNTRKDIRDNMSMIKIELEENIKKIDKAIEAIDKDVDAASAILSGDLRSIPTDTLVAYSNSLTNISLFSYTQDAMEILKISSLAPHIENKQLLLGIIKSYEAMNSMKTAISYYLDNKKKALDDVTERLSPEERRAITSYDIYDLWELYLTNGHMVHFLESCNYTLDKRNFISAKNHIREVIYSIEEEYGL